MIHQPNSQTQQNPQAAYVAACQVYSSRVQMQCTLITGHPLFYIKLEIANDTPPSH